MTNICLFLLIILCFNYVTCFRKIVITHNQYHRVFNPALSALKISSSKTSRNTEFIKSRELGGYERLLSRLTPETNQLSLSHGTSFILDGVVSNKNLVEAVTYIMARHPMLRSFRVRENDDDNSNSFGWKGWDGVYTWNTITNFSKLKDLEPIAAQLVNTVEMASSSQADAKEAFERMWREETERALNEASFPPDQPQWKLTNIVNRKGGESAWVFCVNHGIDDQSSVNIMVNDLLYYLTIIKNNSKNDYKQNSLIPLPEPLPFPPSVEQAVAPGLPSPRTIAWAVFQVLNSLSFPAMIPSRIQRLRKTDPKSFSDCASPSQRSTFCEFFSLSAAETKGLLDACREKEVTVTHALSAAMLMVTAAEMQLDGEGEREGDRVGQEVPEVPILQSSKLRFLLSVGLRPYGVGSTSQRENKGKDFTGKTVACASGAVDFVVGVSGRAASHALRWDDSPKEEKLSSVWSLSAECKRSASLLIDPLQLNFVPESVRLFGIGMQLVDILKAVEIEANNPASLGRGYTCGVSNMGRVDLGGREGERERMIQRGEEEVADLMLIGNNVGVNKISGSSSISSRGGSRVNVSVRSANEVRDWWSKLFDPLKKMTSSNDVKNGDEKNQSMRTLSVREAYYGTSHGRNGVLCLLSCMTIQGRLYGTIQMTSPLMTKLQGVEFKRRLELILKGLSPTV